MQSRRRAALLGGLLACATLLGCERLMTDPLDPSGRGTVHYQSFEGGFYSITSDDGRRFDPMNLPRELQREGLRVRFAGHVRSDVASIHMYGEILELSEIAPE